MVSHVTTLLDVIGLLAVAAGAGVLAAAGSAVLLHDRAAMTLALVGVGALVGGVVLTAGSVLAARRAPAPPVGGQR